MNWGDNPLNDSRVKELLYHAYARRGNGEYQIPQDEMNEIIEISLQAGRKEVVDCLAQNYSEELYHAGLFQAVLSSVEWQAKLKESGIT